MYSMYMCKLYGLILNNPLHYRIRRAWDVQNAYSTQQWQQHNFRPSTGNSPYHKNVECPLPSSSKCVSMPLGPVTEQIKRVFRKELHLFTSILWPPWSFWQQGRDKKTLHFTWPMGGAVLQHKILTKTKSNWPVFGWLASEMNPMLVDAVMERHLHHYGSKKHCFSLKTIK